eukprot:Opistho-2@43188
MFANKMATWPLFVTLLCILGAASPSLGTSNCTTVTLQNYWWNGLATSPGAGSVCHPTINPLNEVCQFCQAVQIPLCVCPKGFYCPAGDDYPNCLRCPSGHYCPYQGDFDPLPCKAGQFCPEGSITPHECYAMDICDAKSSRYVFLAGIFGDVVVVILLAFLLFVFGTGASDRAARTFFRKIGVLVRPEGGIDKKPESADASIIVDPEAPRAKDDTLEGMVPIDLRFENLGYTLRQTTGVFKKTTTEKVLLSGVTGELLHGKVSGVFGPSGAGKTTFLNVLCGKLQRTSGSLYINGEADEIFNYRKVIGFVPQDDVMLRSLTVEEILVHSARTRLPRTETSQQMSTRIDSVLRTLGLSDIRHERIGDERIRGISGGQRKRVNIGMELVAGPALLFLDEPTSGLDSTSSEECMSAMRAIAAGGINVVAVIHQPRMSIFSSIDTMLLLGRGGRTVYNGPAESAHLYFMGLGFKMLDNVSPPDFCLDVVSGAVARAGRPDFTPSELFEDWEKSVAAGGTGDGVGTMEVSVDDNANEDIPSNGAAGATTNRGSLMKRKSLLRLRKFLAKDRARVTASWPVQVLLFLLRAMVQLKHDTKRFLLDAVMFAFTGLYLGLSLIDPKFVSPVPSEVRSTCPTAMLQIVENMNLADKNLKGITDFCSVCFPLVDLAGQMGFYIAMGVGIISAAVAVGTFGDDLVVYWRDASTGIHSSAYFVGKSIADCIKIVVHTSFFLSMFYILAAPLASYGKMFGLMYFLIYCVYGVGYIGSVFLSRETSGFVSVIIAIIWSLCTGVVFDTKAMGPFAYISYPKWFGESVFDIESAPVAYSGLSTYADTRYGYKLGNYGTSIGAMFIIGLVLRAIAFAGLRLRNRDKQR